MEDSRQQLDDAQLTSAILAGDSEAFRQLYFRYAQALFGWLWQRTHNRETAEDLVQELFARLWRKRKGLDPAQSIRAYMYQTANNLAIDHLRRKIRDQEKAQEGERNETTALDELRFERKSAISEAIGALPDGQRAVFLLSRIDGMKYHEIAEALGISIKTVETHMGRALKKLRTLLQHWAPVLAICWLFW